MGLVADDFLIKGISIRDKWRRYKKISVKLERQGQLLHDKKSKGMLFPADCEPLKNTLASIMSQIGILQDQAEIWCETYNEVSNTYSGNKEAQSLKGAITKISKDPMLCKLDDLRKDVSSIRESVMTTGPGPRE